MVGGTMDTDGSRDALFGTHPGCPSELRLDRLKLGELGADEAAGVRDHIRACTRCRERIALRNEGMAAFSGVDAPKLLTRIEQALDTKPTREQPTVTAPIVMAVRKRSGHVFAWTAAIGAVLVGVALALPEGEQVRAKGSLGLTVYREREGRVERAASGDTFRANDRLRFGVDLPDPGAAQIMIVSVERGGGVFAFYPSDGSKRSKAPAINGDGALEGAIALDDSDHDEWIHLIACPHSFSLSDLTPGELPGRVTAPPDCKMTTFVMRKESTP
jgi:hypothetical protein